MKITMLWGFRQQQHARRSCNCFVVSGKISSRQKNWSINQVVKIEKDGRFPLPPLLSFIQRLVGRNCSSHNEQQQQWDNDATSGRRSCFSNDFWFHDGFNNAASESGRSSNRQSGSESDFFHVYLQLSAYRRFLQRRRYAPKNIPRNCSLTCGACRLQRPAPLSCNASQPCRQFGNTFSASSGCRINSAKQPQGFCAISGQIC
jgi:hypothetical protein